ncbi:MAG: nucleotidyltransferase domain-containing protein [Spirochaetales bacterium]|jgi:predicted nucleotidyltransferase|nr:nucleotidyltransferase domain-containing protein [Spirochaetales bacterium]
MNLQAAEAALRSHKSDFTEAYIFGSVANESTDEYSDLDLLLVRETKLPFFDRIREIMELRNSFNKMDLLIYTPEELSTMLAEPGRYFIKNIIETGYRIEGTQDRSQALAEPS